jgi:hypothetical protein
MPPASWRILVKAPYYHEGVKTWAEKGGIGVPQRADRRQKHWVDNEAAAIVASRNTVSSIGWGSFLTVNPATPQFRTYKAIARDPQGRPLLTAIGSPEFYQSWVSQVPIYRDNPHLFPHGVPYLVEFSIPIEEAAELNFGGTQPAWPVPVQVMNDQLLVAAGGDVVVLNGDQEIRALLAAPVGDSDAQRLQAVVDTIAAHKALSRPPAETISAIMTICRRSGNNLSALI